MNDNLNLLKIKNRKKFLRELAIDKKRNADNNLKFAKLHAEWIKRTNNEEWSKRQKILVDEIYKANRRIKIRSAH